MKNALEKFVNEYPKAKNEIFAGNPFGNFVRKDLPDKIYQAVNLDKTKYLITASVGQGNWAMIPWICIFDKSITTTATKGVYIADSGKTERQFRLNGTPFRFGGTL